MKLFDIFFNTTREVGNNLKTYTDQADRQDKMILRLFLESPVKELTSHDVESMLLGKVVRSSVVRSMNTLTRKGFLEKTNMKRMGKYGRACYIWRLVEPVVSKGL